ncbi:hypothetical protein MT325_m446R [Paramecium bursaria chlorella virus MT325]|uniref:Uncharacterized protein m446R n=1 Tax=Paramecium bursaria Chlorella virus MT325 TaxID=346932 RepID=A7IUH6_PBCVM|nr:hypothetical protein MT325_m446R [Paramecium bursaria chlorella virus MT325]
MKSSTSFSPTIRCIGSPSSKKTLVGRACTLNILAIALFSRNSTSYTSMSRFFMVSNFSETFLHGAQPFFENLMIAWRRPDEMPLSICW